MPERELIYIQPKYPLHQANPYKVNSFLKPMLKIPLNEVKERLLKEARLTPVGLEDKIKDKINELAGLVSEEGAVYIIANELGIQLLEPEGPLKIKHLAGGMRNIDLLAKVTRKFDVREFQGKDGTPGKVGSFMVGDETGTCRIVLWHKMTEVMGSLKEEDTVRIKSGYAKENNGYLEVHLNDKSIITVNPAGETVIEVKKNLSFERRKIESLKENEQNVEVFGTITQVFDPRFFPVCPKCSKKVNKVETDFICNEHQKVEPAYSYVLNIVLDDGTSNIRAVLWRSQMEKLLKKSEAEIALFREQPEAFGEIKNALLGEQIKMVGKVNKNIMFDKLEFFAQLVYTDVKPEEEISRLENAV